MTPQTGLDPELWKQVKVLFEAALELSAGERPRFIEEQCVRQPELAAPLRSMLEAHEEPLTLLDRSLPERIKSLSAEAGESSGLSPGMTMGGRYRLVRELGRGGNGFAWEAEDESVLGRNVVVKILRSDGLGQAFDTELKALARLDHASIAIPMDSGFCEDGRRFLVLEYVNGPALRELLAEGPLEPMRACRLIRQVAAALDSAHKRDVWHLDLKPENVLIRDAGDEAEQAVLVDFGIARLSGTAYQDAAPPAGSLAYAATEQLAGRPCSSSDQYSLARMAVEMITGHRPGPLESAGSLLARCGALRPSVIAVFRRALSERPEARYSSATGFAFDLQAQLDPDVAVSRRRRMAAAALCLVLFGMIAVYVWRNRSRESAMVQREIESARSQLALVSSLLELGRLDESSLSGAVRGSVQRLQALVESGNKDPLLLQELFNAQMRLGSMHGHPGIPHIGSVHEGIESYEAALRSLELLYEGRPKDWRYAEQLFWVRDCLASNLIEAGHYERSASISRDTLVMVRQWEAAGWPRERADAVRADVFMTLSRYHFHAAQWEQCAALRSEGVRLKRAMAAAPHGADQLQQLAGVLAARGYVYREMRRFEEALKDYAESDSIIGRLRGSGHRNLTLEWLSARNRLETGKTMLASEKAAEAEPLLLSAVSAHRRLAEDHPQSVGIQRTYALSLAWLGTAQSRLKRPQAEWRALFVEAGRVAHNALQRDPLNAKAREETSLIRRQAAACGIMLAAPAGPPS